MKLALFRQPAGLGDILFTLKIAFKVNEKYNPGQIVWPVCKEYIDLCSYLEVPNNFYFISDQVNFPGREIYDTFTTSIVYQPDFIYVPLQFASEGVYGHFDFKENLYSKYKFVGLNYNDWSSYIKIKRNYDKEDQLYALKVKQKPYILVNRNYGTVPVKREDIAVNSDKAVVELEYVEGYNLFDWIKIIEEADEVHTLQTSLAYILEVLKKQKVYIYHRTKNANDIKNNPIENTFYYCQKFHNPNWIFEDLTIT